MSSAMIEAIPVILFFVLWIGGIVYVLVSLFAQRRKKVKHGKDPRLCVIPNDGIGRFVCSPEKRKFDFSPTRKKFYVFRKGEQLPKHLKVVRICADYIIENSHFLYKEAFENEKIDTTIVGYNALLDYVCEPLAYPHGRRGVNIRARAALIVSENYPGNIDDLERDIDESKSLIYGRKLYDQEP